MIARILLFCDSTAASCIATQTAFRLATETGADLTGLAGIDLSLIEVRMPGGIGMASHKARLEEALRSEATAHRESLRSQYQAECQKRGAHFDWIAFEGEGSEDLTMASQGHDLVVTGFDAGFGPHQSGLASEMIAHSLAAIARPLLICPAEEAIGDTILVAYDGSAPSMRALQLFVLSGIGKGKSIAVVAVNEDEIMANRTANGPVAYLRRHGYMAQGVPVIAGGRPDAAIQDQIRKRRPSMMVMGAYGHRGLKALLFGSTTKGMITAPPCPLFIYH
jgi:nucleotide-binding universal stress UspA family protein